jgi:AAA+ superfamily predicted ATPase
VLLSASACDLHGVRPRCVLGTCLTIAALRAQLRYLVTFDTLGNPAVPTVLLQGEPGTDKSLVARVLHDSGSRAQGPFLDVNCAAPRGVNVTLAPGRATPDHEWACTRALCGIAGAVREE